MFWRRSIRDVVARWQSGLENSIETGHAPIFDLSIGNQLVDGIVGLLALQQLDEQRSDIQFPIIVAGGGSMVWLAALMRDSMVPDPSQDDSYHNLGEMSSFQIVKPAVIYSGEDLPTHMASLGTHIPLSTIDESRHLSPTAIDYITADRIQTENNNSQNTLDLPVGMTQLTSPSASSSATVPWESFPLLVLDLLELPASHHDPQSDRQEEEGPVRYPSTFVDTTTTEWLSWSCTVVAILSLLFAILV